MKPWSVEQLCLAGACALPVLTGAAVLLALRQPQPAPFAQLLATSLLGLLPAALLLLIHRRASARLTLNVGRYQHLFNSAHDVILVLVAIRCHYAQDFQHGIGIIRIPAAGAKPYLSENLTVMKGPVGKCV